MGGFVKPGSAEMRCRNLMLILGALTLVYSPYSVCGAPTVKSSVPYWSSSDSDCFNDEVNELWTSVQQNNSEVILAEFSTEDNKICVPIRYKSSSCTTINNQFVIWTKFNIFKAYGKAMFYFISIDNKVPVMPGFAWNEACSKWTTVSYHEVATDEVAIINVDVNPDLCNRLGFSLEIKCITTLMPMYAVQLENGITNKAYKPLGYAVKKSTVDSNNEDIQHPFNILIDCVIILFVFSVIGVLYFLIEESIHVTKDSKPRMYFHFWSAISIIFGAFIYFAYSESFADNPALLVIVVVLFAVIVYPITLLTLSCRRYKRTDDKVYIRLFTAPFTAVVPTTLGKFTWQFIMTVFALYFTAVGICYVLYISANIMLMYYFFPLRTLIRSFYVFGAIFYAILIGAFVLYQFEKSIEILKLFVYMVTHNCVKVDFPTWSFHRLMARTTEDHDNHKNYYLKEFKANAVKYGSSGGTLLMMLSLVKFVLSILFLIVYILAAIWLGELLFERTVYIMSSIDSLLIILPTVALLILTFLFRNIIFDLPVFIDYDNKKKSGLHKGGKQSNTNGRIERDDSSLSEEEVLTYQTFCQWLTGKQYQKTYRTSMRFHSKRYNNEKKPLLREETRKSRAAQFEFEGGFKKYGTYTTSPLPEESGNWEESTGFNENSSLEIEKSQKSWRPQLKPVKSVISGANDHSEEIEGISDAPGSEVKRGSGTLSKRYKKQKVSEDRSSNKLTPNGLDLAENLTAVGAVASGVGDVASGVGSLAGAFGESDSTVSAMGGVATGVGGVLGGVGEATKGIGSLAKTFGSNAKTDQRSGSKEGYLSERVQGVGSVASGVGSTVKSVGGMTQALGGAGNMANTIGGVASGVGGVIGGVGSTAKGVGSLMKTFRGGSAENSKDTRKKVSEGLQGAGKVASGIGETAKGIGGMTQALGGSNSTVSTISGVTSGVGGIIGGVGTATQGVGSLTKAFSKQSEDSGSKGSDNNDRLSEGVKGVGNLASGAGEVAQGVGGIVQAVGGENSAITKAGEITSGVGGAVSGLGSAATGMSSLVKKKRKRENKDKSTLSEDLEAVGTVASGAGKAVKGVGTVTGALGGDASTVNTIGDTVSGAGGVFSGIAKALKGIFGRNKNEEERGKESKAQADGRPSEGAQTEDKPSEGAQTEDGSSEGVQTEDEPSEGAQREDEPSEGAQREDELSEGAQREDEPSEGAQREDRPFEGAQTEDEPSEGAQTEDESSEGAQREDRPFEGVQTEDEPSEGAQREDRPFEGAQTEDEPSEGAQTKDEPSDEAQKEDGQVEGAQRGDGPSEGAPDDDRPSEGVSSEHPEDAKFVVSVPKDTTEGTKSATGASDEDIISSSSNTVRATGKIPGEEQDKKSGKESKHGLESIAEESSSASEKKVSEDQSVPFESRQATGYAASAIGGVKKAENADTQPELANPQVSSADQSVRDAPSEKSKKVSLSNMEQESPLA